jgi:ribA/ribD-fused uncharacterized protein
MLCERLTALAKNSISKFSGDWAFLSNFAPIVADWEGILYPTAEHAFQAAKTDNEHQRFRIYQATTPKRAKLLGRSVDLRSDWEEGFKLVAMEHVVTSKFTLFEDKKTMLLSTNGAELVEGNYWHDNFWGNCYCGRNSSCTYGGKNHLGKILMKVREEIYNAKSS